MEAEFTAEGMRRLLCIDEGPCFCVAARLVMEPDGREVAIQHIPAPEPASQGRSGFILPAPPGGGCVRSADLIAADGTPIYRVYGPIYLSDGDTLHIPVEIS